MKTGGKLTEEDGYQALRTHLVDRAARARAKYGPRIDLDAMLRMLEDRDVVRFPTRVQFGEESLVPGEFAHAEPLGPQPADGFVLHVHGHYRDRVEDLPLLLAYHVPSINYLDVVTGAEAELFGATLLGLEIDEYYGRLCELADELAGAAR